MSTALERRKLDQQMLTTGVDALARAGGGLVTLATHPVYSIILGAALIEYLQRVSFGTGRYEWQSQPGTHALVPVEIREPLLSQHFASTLEGVILTTSALTAVSNALGTGGLAGILGKFIGK